MAILQSPLVQILLWVVAAAATVWILGPGVMYLRRKNRFWMDVSDDPADAAPDGSDRKYAERFQQFVALGFRPAGKTVENGRFMNPLQWTTRGDMARFVVSPDRKTFVSLYRAAEGNLLRTTAHSTFNEGGLIMTAAPGMKMPAEVGGNYKYDAVGEAEPEELLGMHARRVEEFARARKLTVKAATMRELAAEDEKHSQLLLPKAKRGQLAGLLFMFLMPAVTAVFAAAMGRVAIAPVIICVAAAMYALIRWSVLPSRVPMMVRMAVMAAGLFVPAMLAIRATTADKTVARVLDRLDARPARDPARTVDWIVQHGPWGCTPLVQRLESPTSKPETRKIAHDALVKLHGSDLGETRAAWQAWCAEVAGPKN